MRVVHEYRRFGTCAYLVAWDVHRGELFGTVVDRGTVVASDAFVAHVMEQEPYRSGEPVFGVVDSCEVTPTLRT